MGLIITFSFSVQADQLTEEQIAGKWVTTGSLGRPELGSLRAGDSSPSP